MLMWLSSALQRATRDGIRKYCVTTDRDNYSANTLDNWWQSHTVQPICHPAYGNADDLNCCAIVDTQGTQANQEESTILQKPHIQVRSLVSQIAVLALRSGRDQHDTLPHRIFAGHGYATDYHIGNNADKDDIENVIEMLLD